MGSDDQYVHSLEIDGADFRERQRSHVRVKTSQQKLLEQLLIRTGRRFERIGDIACGGGALSFHLADLYPSAHFTLVDLNGEALDTARQTLADRVAATFLVDDIYRLERVPDDQFDLTCCWQTLSWLEDPRAALRQLVRCTRPGGLIFLSSLFNLDHDVDIYARVSDHTRPSVAQGHYVCYNTYSARTVAAWLDGLVASHRYHPHHIEIDLRHDGRGLGTSTKRLQDGSRIQVSGGILLNWAVLEIEK